MTPCSTLEQRWSACRARVYVAADWEAQWGDTPRLDMFSCTIWREFAVAYHDRPCTSPKRPQCRAGTSYHDPQLPTMPRTWSGSWDWFQIDPRDVIDPAVWPRMVSRLRQMKTITESVDFEEPDPIV